MPKFSWIKRGGYECSSKGDKRFSALYALMPDGRTIEQHYQCDVKGYQPGGHNWKYGKGKPALNPDTNLWEEYLNLWRVWAQTHQNDLEDLRNKAAQYNNVLSDCFANTPVNQAHALATLLNEIKPMEEFKLIVAGGRDFNDYNRLHDRLVELSKTIYEDVGISIVSGAARGADALALDFASHYGVTYYEMPADWDTYGKRAGFMRNEEMGRFANGLLAFWDGQSKGTAHMIKFMQSLNKPVHIERY